MYLMSYINDGHIMSNQYLGLGQTFSVGAVDDKDDSADFGEVIFPQPPGLLMSSELYKVP